MRFANRTMGLLAPDIGSACFRGASFVMTSAPQPHPVTNDPCRLETWLLFVHCCCSVCAVRKRAAAYTHSTPVIPLPISASLLLLVLASATPLRPPPRSCQLALLHSPARPALSPCPPICSSCISRTPRNCSTTLSHSRFPVTAACQTS